MTHTERLTEERILELLNRYRTSRDRDAREKLVLQYANLVECIARRFAASGEPVEDMVQEGYIGLISALEGFDTGKGVKFSTYATHFIIGQIKHYLRDKGKIIKEPAWLQELSQRMTRVIDSLSQRYGRQPTEQEIASVMKIREDDVRDLLTTREVFKVSSLDGEREDGSGPSPELEKAKAQKCESFQLPMEDRMVLDTALTRLKSIEQRVIHEYFFKDLNQTEIARKLGISCNYVSHILRKSTGKLRKHLTTEDIREVQLQLRALHQRGAAEEAARAAVTDPGSGLYSRPYFLARLEEEVSRSVRSGYPVSAMILTLDYMSDVHGGWTPLTADEMLYRIGQNVAQRVRRADIVARYSANQFALMLPHTGSVGERVCERIKSIVQEMNCKQAGELLYVRGRLTFAAYPEDASNFADLLDRVEKGRPVVSTEVEYLKKAA